MSFTFNFTKDQLKEMIPKNPYLDNWYKAISEILPEYEINTPQRVAAFLAQCAHESGGFIFQITKQQVYAKCFLSISQTMQQQRPTLTSQKRSLTEFMLVVWETVTNHLETDGATVVED